MNDLNSILFEGYNINSPIDGFFTILSKRNHCGQWKGIEIRVKTTLKLKESVEEKMMNFSRDIRVVGRLESDENGVYIFAERIEFKPMKNSGQLNLF